MPDKKIILDDKIREALRYRYNKNGYLLFEEVKRSTGYIKPERFADAIAISIFPSNGITLTGFEIKTSRQDLLSELREPEKSEAIKQFCDYWVLIVNDRKILDGKIQIPDDWGIWEYYTTGVGVGGFIIKRKPKQLYPKPPDRYFLASLLRHHNRTFEANR